MSEQTSIHNSPDSEEVSVLDSLDSEESSVLDSPDSEEVSVLDSPESEESSVLDLQIQDLEGVGPTTEKKLKDAGVSSVLDLSVSLPAELSDRIGGTKENASAMIFAAQRLLMDSGLIEKEFVPAIETLEKRKTMMKCTTGSTNLDDLFKGGIETQAITEFYGDFGSGKSQICHTLSITSQLANEEGGLNGSVIYIDTEGTFRPERIEQISESKGIDPLEILKNILVCKAYNSSHLELIIRSLGKYIEQHKTKLIVIDSIISLHRAEFMGRGTLADRQQKLNAIIHRLLRVAEIYNVAVIVTNQVQSTPDVFFGDPTKPAGGHVIAHACTYRVYLRKSGQDRTAIMMDSPYHPYSDTRFRIFDGGVENAEAKKKVSK